MAGKADDRLPARHILITGGTGSGKTMWVKRCSSIQETRIQLLWDPDASHNARHITRPRAYLRAVRDGLRSGLKMRLGLSTVATELNFQYWCAIVWAACCCSRPIVAVIEELAEVTGPGKARGNWQTLLNRGRKYAVQIVAISQRPQEIDKTTLTQCSTKVTGTLDRDVDRVLMARELSVDPARIVALRTDNALNRLNYLVLQPGQPTVGQIINPRRPRSFSLPVRSMQ